ncbi:hypothetical protein SAMN05443582_102313 [Phyllobacterium sp. OV277]|nr:hypothetical protein SAMN05443582_102313 [Phyllobacterium sp. OV277]
MTYNTATILPHIFAGLMGFSILIYVILRSAHLHEDCAWFDKLTMREMGGVQSQSETLQNRVPCNPPLSLMVSLSNHAQSTCNPSESARA